MNRAFTIGRRLLLLLVAVAALAGCAVLGVSTLPPDLPEPTATVEGTATSIPPTEVPPTAPATTPPLTVVIAAPATPTEIPTEVRAPTATTAPPTNTPEPKATSTPVPTTTKAAQAPTTKPATATKEPTANAATPTKVPTAKASATNPPAPSGKVVGLDPGHHSLDQGGDSSLVGVPEYKLTMSTALLARKYLVASGYTVRLSRTGTGPVSCWCASDYTAKVQAEQEARIRAVGAVKAYVPIHFNASPSNQDKRASNDLKGTEAYYNVDQRFVASQSQALARSLASNVVSRIRSAGYPATNRGARSDLLVGKSYGHYFGLRGPYPASLLESLFMDQKDDAAALRDPKIQDAIARGIADGIKAFVH